jgi:heme A synthase
VFVGLLQAAIGYTQYFNDVPPLLVGLHVAGATMLWAMTVSLLLHTQAVESLVTALDHGATPGLVPSRSR